MLIRLEGQERSDVDDLAAAPRPACAPGGRTAGTPVQVHLDHRVPVLVEVSAAGARRMMPALFTTM